MGTSLPDAILAWASAKPSPFDADDDDDDPKDGGSPKHEGYLSAGEIAVALEAAVEDGLVECGQLDGHAIGKALGRDV